MNTRGRCRGLRLLVVGMRVRVREGMMEDGHVVCGYDAGVVANTATVCKCQGMIVVVIGSGHGLVGVDYVDGRIAGGSTDVVQCGVAWCHRERNAHATVKIETHEAS